MIRAGRCTKKQCDEDRDRRRRRSPGSSPPTCCTARTRSRCSRRARYAGRAHEHRPRRHRATRRITSTPASSSSTTATTRTSSGCSSALGVAGAAVDMSFARHRRRGDFEYSGTSPNGLFAKRAHLVTPWFHRMVADLVRFNREARDAAARPTATGPSLGRLAGASAATRGAFVERLIVPQASAVWSADPRADVDVPGALPGRVLRQPRDARLPRPAAVADGRRRLARATSRR